MNCEKLSNPSMDKKHTVSKAKEESTMEKKKKNDKSKSILEILHLELIQRILLRVPVLLASESLLPLPSEVEDKKKEEEGNRPSESE